MLNKNAKPERCWQEIAADAAHEANPEKLLELSTELANALDRRKKALRAICKPIKSDLKKKLG
jgi:hypothetical protein